MNLESSLRVRTAARVISSIRTMVGNGFVVRRPFPSHLLPDLDPFLLFDQLGPVELPPGSAVGPSAPYPQSGFEELTYLVAGRLEHREADGGASVIGPGDVRHVTAGSGLLQAREIERGLQRMGGPLHGFHLWVNLPRRDKRIAPWSREVAAADVPRWSRSGALVRVIAGEAFGGNGPVLTRTPVMMLHCNIRPGAQLEVPVPDGWTAFAYVADGEGGFGCDERRAEEGQLVVFGRDGGVVRLSAEAAPLDAFVVAGQPLHEPVARYAGIVANSEAEIAQAIEDYRRGRMGLRAPGVA